MVALSEERRAETEAMLADAQAVEEKRLADFLEDQRLAIGRRLESEEAGARAAVAERVVRPTRRDVVGVCLSPRKVSRNMTPSTPPSLFCIQLLLFPYRSGLWKRR